MDFSFLRLAVKSDSIGARSLCKAIRGAIDDGRLKRGEKMPSSRELSLYIGIARATVVSAYDQLIDIGYLVAKKGTGTFIAGESRTPRKNDLNPVRVTPFDWSMIANDQARRLLSLPADASKVLGDWEPLNHGALPPDLLPARQWRKIILNRFLEETSSFECKSLDMLGYVPLRESICGFLRRTQGVVCKAEQIVIFASNQSALNQLFSVLVSPNDLAVCEEPCYAGIREQFRLKGADIISIPIDKDGIKVDLLPPSTDVKFLYLTAAHQDPTGVTLSLERRMQILEWAASGNTCIIEDAWDTDFHYTGAPAPPLFSLDSQGRVIYLYTFWKTLFPLVSTGFLVLPEPLVPMFRVAKFMFDMPVPLIEHLALAELISEGELERHLRKIWKVLRIRRQALIHELTVNFGTSISILSGAGLHLIARFSEKWTEEQIRAAACRSELPIACTFESYSKTSPENEFMIYFADIPEAHTGQRVRDFVQALKI